MAEKYIMVNLKQSKQIAQAISNNTSRKILEYLAEKDAAETEISKKLNIPLTTAHYNIQNLVKCGLVKVEEFKWSKKGREINLYKLSKKLIIISPEESVKTNLKNLIPVGLISLGAAFVIYLYNIFARPISKMAAPAIFERAEEATIGAAPAIQTATPNYALWFLFGSIFTLIVLLVLFLIRRRLFK